MPKTKTKKPRRRLPAFRDDAEERKFWETHDAGEYLTEMRPARVRVSRHFAERVKARSRRFRQEPAG